MSESLEITQHFEQSLNITASSSRNEASQFSEIRVEISSPRVLTERVLTTFAFIAFTSVIGLLIRLGLVLAFTLPSDQQQTFPLLYPQFFGCLLMGFYVESKPWLISRHSSFYSALASGLCGSITTFSSWNLGLFQALSGFNSAQNDFTPSAQQSIVNGISQSVLTICLAYSGLVFGEAIGKSIKLKFWGNNCVPSVLVLEPITLFSSATNRPTLIDRRAFSEKFCFLAIFLACIVVIVLSCIFEWNQFIISSGFAPIGAGLRYFLSRLNSRSSKFPVGTFIANAVGSGVLAATTYFSLFSQRAQANSSQKLILKALADGFCGCLSTVSTFIMELKALKTITLKIRYLAASLVVGQLLFLILFWLPTFLSFSNSD